MTVTRRKRVLLVLVLALPVMVWVVPGLRARAKAVAVLADASALPFPRPFARDVEVETTEVAPGVVGDLYSGERDAPVMLFVPGATPKGSQDARVIEAATAIARAGRRVFVPELDLYDRTFSTDDIERLVSAMVGLSGDSRVGVLGFSYGGSLALIAAQDSRTRSRVAYVATFGAYFDLVHVLQGVTTGSTVLDGDEVAFETVPEARDILIDATVELASGRYADEIVRALDGDDPNELPEGPQSLVELLSNRDPQRIDELVAQLPPAFRTLLERFSPSTAIHELEAPVLVLQSKKDVATPWTEAELLHRSAEGSRLMMLDHFSHVDPPGPVGWLNDGPRAWRWLSWVLAEQE
ncbi:MAG: alpha/beta hydrolase family protein [Actinomycetota bacterium]